MAGGGDGGAEQLGSRLALGEEMAARKEQLGAG